MTDLKISQLPVAGALSGTEPVPVVQGATTKQATAADIALTLANTAVTPATYGDATHVGQFTVDAKGRITAAADVAISGGGSPGGSTTEVQYNNAGAFGGVRVLTFSGDVLTLSTFPGAGSPAKFIIDGSETPNAEFIVTDGSQFNVANSSSMFFDSSSQLVIGGVSVQASAYLSGVNTAAGLFLNSGGWASFIQEAEFVVHKVADFTIDDTYGNGNFDNAAAGAAVNFTLLDPNGVGEGFVLKFCVLDAQTLTLTATGGAKIYNGASASSADGTMFSNTVGSFVRIVGRDFTGANGTGTDWVVESVTGSWTLT